LKISPFRDRSVLLDVSEPDAGDGESGERPA
jgi:hypothetical protein